MSAVPERIQFGLWGGWTVFLPTSQFERNADGSWSAWGADWTIDIQIIEVGEAAAEPQALLGPDRPANISGRGWIGSAQVIQEVDNETPVFRLTSWLAAKNLLMSCWISFFAEHQKAFAEGLLQAVAHNEGVPSGSGH
jgi:hypothetical protein